MDFDSSAIPNYSDLISKDNKKKKRPVLVYYPSEHVAYVGKTKDGKSNLCFEMVRAENENDPVAIKAGKKPRPIDVLVLCTKNPQEEFNLEYKRIYKERCIVVDSPFKLPRIDFFNPAYHNQIIFDDILNENEKTNKRILEYFQMFRKKGGRCKILTQSFFGIPRTMRNQCDRVFARASRDAQETRSIVSRFKVKPVILTYLFKILPKYHFLGVDMEGGVSDNLTPINISGLSQELKGKKPQDIEDDDSIHPPDEGSNYAPEKDSGSEEENDDDDVDNDECQYRFLKGIKKGHMCGKLNCKLHKKS